MKNRSELLKDWHVARALSARCDKAAQSPIADTYWTEQLKDAALHNWVRAETISAMIEGQRQGQWVERERAAGRVTIAGNTEQGTFTEQVSALIREYGLSWTTGYLYASLPFIEARFFLRAVYLKD